MSEFYLPLIPPFKTKKQKMALLQEIVCPKCADLLRANGFVCYKDEDLSWYRIAGGCVLQVIFFYSTCIRLPLQLRIGFGCYPLMFEPPIPHPLSDKGRKYRAPIEMFESPYWTFPLNPALQMHENRLIFSLPNNGEAEIIGRYLLPLLNEVQTEELAYKRQKERVIKNFSELGHPGGISFCFAEEAVCIADEEMYPLCKELALLGKDFCIECEFDAKMQLHAEQMLEYFETGDRAKYMQLMEERKQNTRKLLKKKLNI